MSGKYTDKVVSSIGDSVVRESDVRLLEGPHWLSDRIIGFYFEYLHKIIFEDSSKFCFISPEVSQFLKLVETEEMNCFVEPLDLISKEVILLAVNNAVDPSRPGGSHWSLLAYTSQADHFYHFDSSSGINGEDARILSKKMHTYLKSRSNKESSSFHKSVPFTEVHGVLQQSNGYDCGIHVLANAKHSSRHLMVYGSPDGLPKLEAKEVKELRKKLKNIILDSAQQSNGNEKKSS